MGSLVTCTNKAMPKTFQLLGQCFAQRKEKLLDIVLKVFINDLILLFLIYKHHWVVQIAIIWNINRYWNINWWPVNKHAYYHNHVAIKQYV